VEETQNQDGADRREGRRPTDLARQLSLTPSVVYAAIAAGEFGCVWRFGKTGRAIVIPEEAVQRWPRSKQHDGRNVVA
jgi:hypothetical protein